MKRRQTSKLHLARTTIRQLDHIQLVDAVGGRIRLSSPTDEMGACGPTACASLATCSCTTPPPVR